MQDGLTARSNCLTPQSEAICLLVPKSGAFRRLPCRIGLKSQRLATRRGRRQHASISRRLRYRHSPKMTSTISRKLTGPDPRAPVADTKSAHCSKSLFCRIVVAQNRTHFWHNDALKRPQLILLNMIWNTSYPHGNIAVFDGHSAPSGRHCGQAQPRCGVTSGRADWLLHRLAMIPVRCERF